MALYSVELNVGGTSFKGVYVAIVLSAATSIAGVIWSASTFFSRLEALEASVADASARTDVIEGRFKDLREGQSATLQGYQVTISNMEQQLVDNDISSLGSKLATLGTQLDGIAQAQGRLLDLQERVAAVEKSNGETVISVQNRLESLERAEKVLMRTDVEIENIWQALDSLPYSSR